MLKYLSANKSLIVRQSLFTILLALIGLPFNANANQSAYVYRSFPGYVNAYEYDKGGEGVAYHDLDRSNTSKTYRAAGGVDIGSRDGQLEVRASAGEWLEYTVKVTSATRYRFKIIYSENNSSTAFKISVGSKAVSKTVTSTGSSSKFQVASLPGTMYLSRGYHVFRLSITKGSPNIRRIIADKAYNSWIAKNFSAVRQVTGNSTSRKNIEAPVLVSDVNSACCGKYAYAVYDKYSPKNPRSAFMNVHIKNLKSSDRYGAGISTSNSYPGNEVFISNVSIEPNWPNWRGYSNTNYDGVTIDAADLLIAKDLYIKNWNADAAVDTKALKNQFVGLRIYGRGHRAMRIWRPGPHYIVASDINNDGGLGEGSLIWIKDCRNTVLNIYKSKFNGSSKIPSTKLKCDSGSSPTINYLSKDPRKTGEMHPLFNN